MTMKKSTSQILKDNTMLIVLVLVYLFFTIRTGGAMFSPFNFNELITQNAYVFILASGMLMCMLTGGNIDLACGSLVCFLGAIGAYFMAVRMMPVPDPGRISGIPRSWYRRAQQKQPDRLHQRKGN